VISEYQGARLIALIALPQPRVPALEKDWVAMQTGSKAHQNDLLH